MPVYSCAFLFVASVMSLRECNVCCMPSRVAGMNPRGFIYPLAEVTGSKVHGKDIRYCTLLVYSTIVHFTILGYTILDFTMLYYIIL